MIQRSEHWSGRQLQLLRARSSRPLLVLVLLAVAQEGGSFWLGADACQTPVMIDEVERHLHTVDDDLRDERVHTLRARRYRVDGVDWCWPALAKQQKLSGQGDDDVKSLRPALNAEPACSHPCCALAFGRASRVSMTNSRTCRPAVTT